MVRNEMWYHGFGLELDEYFGAVMEDWKALDCMSVVSLMSSYKYSPGNRLLGVQ